MRRGALLGAAVLSLSLGCAEIFGLGDYTEGDGGSTDAASDAPLPMGDGGCSTSSGFACVPVPPGGWTFVGYDQIFRPACPGQYGTSIDVLEGLSAPEAGCGCSCAIATAPCSSLTITAGDAGANGCENQNRETNVPYDGGCNQLPTNIQAGQQASASLADNGSCAPDAGVTLPAVTSSQGRVCELLAAPGGGCEAGLECVPGPAPYNACVYRTGYQPGDTCPTAYPQMHVIGTTVSDTRGCTACTCTYNAGAACGGTLTLMKGGNCNVSGSATVTANGTCQGITTSGGGAFSYFTFSPTGGGGATCTPSSTSPTGSVTFTDPALVCCTN